MNKQKTTDHCKTNIKKVKSQQKDKVGKKSFVFLARAFFERNVEKKSIFKMITKHFRFRIHISTEVRIHLTLNKTSRPLTSKHVFRGVVYEHDLTTHTDHIPSNVLLQYILDDIITIIDVPVNSYGRYLLRF